MIRKVFKESLLYTLANQAPLLINIFILPLLTPYLTSKDYGIYGLALAYIGGFSALALLGYIALFQNAYFKNNENYKEVWAKYMGILTLWRIPFSLIVAFVLYLVFRNKVPAEDLFFLLTALIVPILFFDLSKSLGIRICQYTGKHKYVYRITFIVSLITLLSTFVGIYFFRLGYKAWLISYFISSFVYFVYYKIVIIKIYKIKISFSFSKKDLKESLKLALPLLPHSYASYFIDSSDRLILDIFKVEMADIGKYNLAYSFANYFKSFSDAMNSIVVPLYFRVFKNMSDTEGGKLIKSITLLWYGFLLISAFLLSLWLKEIFAFLYRNDELKGAYIYSIFIVFSLCYQPIYALTVSKIIYQEKSKEIMKISLFSSILNILLNLVLIPFWGIIGSVIATFISYICMGFIGFLIEEFRISTREKYPVLLLLFFIVFFSFLSYFLKDLIIELKIFVTFLCFIIIFVLWVLWGKKAYKKVNSFPTLLHD